MATVNEKARAAPSEERIPQTGREPSVTRHG